MLIADLFSYAYLSVNSIMATEICIAVSVQVKQGQTCGKIIHS